MGIVAGVLLFGSQAFAYDGHGGYPVAFSKSYPYSSNVKLVDSNNNNWTHVLRI
jgi:hypothetical protein